MATEKTETEKACDRLERAVTNVAQAARGVHDSAEERRDGSFLVNGEDMAELKEAIKEWTNAGNALRDALCAAPVTAEVRHG